MPKNPNIQSCFQRFEKKYLLTPEQYSAVQEAVRPYLRPDEYGRYSICNLYYDTDNYQLIRASLEKPVYKEKLRIRSYGVPGDSDSVFVELKKKFRGEVYKRRVVMTASQAMDFLSGAELPCPETQICRELAWFLAFYQPAPKVLIAYDRQALAGRENSELRITFDTNLRWRASDLDLRRGDQGAPLLPDDQILMEIKIPGAAPVWLGHLLSEWNIYPCSFSKYGVCYRQNLMRRETAYPTKEAFSCA